MELTVLSNDAAVVRMQMKGQLVQSHLRPPECMSQLLGDAGYSKKVILGMAETTFIDSSGIGWLLKCNKRFREASGALVVHTVPPIVLDMMKVMRLEQVLAIVEDEQAALALVQGAQP